jgi:cobalt-precorrin-6B (C15)-methyltransferase
MARIDLPHDAKAGPTKAEVRSVLLDKLRLDADTHFVEIGSCTGAVTVEAACVAGRVTALERKEKRAAVTRKNLAANGIPVVEEAPDGPAGDPETPTTDGGAVATRSDVAPVEVRVDEAPDGLPEDADSLFLGGSRNYEAVLEHARETGVDRIVMNVSRLEVAGNATEAFRERDLLSEVVQFQVSHGYELAGATSFDSDNPVYMLVGSATEADDGGGTA